LPVTVDTGDDKLAFGWQNQRKCLHAVGLYWLFGSDGYNLCYWTSPDCETWSAKTIVSTTNPIEEGVSFSVRHFKYLGVDYVYLTTGIDATMFPLTFMRGKLNPDGTITWETEIIVRTASIIVHYGFPDICVCTDGRLMIVYCYGTATSHSVYVSHNPNNDGTGTWTHTRVMASIAVEICQPTAITALTGGKAYATASRAGSIHGNYWDGATWLGEEVIDPAGTLVTKYSLASVNDTVYIVFYDTYDYIVYMRIRNAVWSDRISVSTGECFICTLSVSPVGDAYAFGVDRRAGTVYDNIFGFKYEAGVWTGLGIIAPDEFESAVYGINSLINWVNNKCLVVWAKGELAPYELRAHLYVPIVIVVIPRITGDGLTQTIYVS